MSRLALALAFMLAGPCEAAAHCFTIWHYKTPQHCGVRLARGQPRRPPAQQRPLPAAPAVRPVLLDEAALRAKAVEELRQALRLRQAGLQ